MVPAFFRIVVLLSLTLGALTACRSSSAQAIPGSQGTYEVASRLPAPVRRVARPAPQAGTESARPQVEQTTYHHELHVSPRPAFAPPLPPHLVLDPPPSRHEFSSHPHAGGHLLPSGASSHEPWGQHEDRPSQPPRRSWTKLHYPRGLQPPPATIPHANRKPVWKTPYSYGYFGAKSSRKWTLHHGYRDRSTQWRLQ